MSFISKERYYEVIRVIEKLSNAVDPISGCGLASDSVIGNSHIRSALADAKRLMENPDEIKRAKRTYELPHDVSPLEAVCTVSSLVARINEFAEAQQCSRILPRDVTAWLLSKGYLEESSTDATIQGRRATEKGRLLGIISSVKLSAGGYRYIVNSYNCDAQRYICMHLEDISAFLNEK